MQKVLKKEYFERGIEQSDRFQESMPYATRREHF